MFLGHFGAALAFKRLEPKLSLGTLFLAVQLPDILWGAFLLRGCKIVTGRCFSFTASPAGQTEQQEQCGDDRLRTKPRNRAIDGGK